MFDVGLMELAVIALVAIVVFGPDKLPELAKQAGQFVRMVRNLATSARDDLRSELGPEYADLELRDLDPRAMVKKHLRDALEDDPDDSDDDLPARAAVANKPRRPGLAPLPEGALPPYDPDAT